MSETTSAQTGTAALNAMFAGAKAARRAAFLPYYPIGFPNYEQSIDSIVAMAEAGVDGFEIGMPFSDPLADGPVIQAATQRALENGTTVRVCLQAVRELRSRGVHQPLLMMGYINPLLAYGIDVFVRDAKAAGADGLIVPDLPPEEGALFAESCAREGLAMVFFLAPTSSPDRIDLVARQATGFIYMVSLTGITGARSELPPDLTTFVSRVRARAPEQRLVLGFGISKPEQARQMNGLVDGFIVGSALVRAGGESVDAVRTLVTALCGALD